MTAAQHVTPPRVRLGKLSLGRFPRVVGTLQSQEIDPAAVVNRKKPACDIVELRLDQMPSVKNWVKTGLALESADVPVIVTVRLKVEGGNWKRADKERLPLYDAALTNVSAVDVELRSRIVKRVCGLAKRRGRCCIVSFHDFEKTPPLDQLKRVAASAQKLGSVIKIVTMLHTKADVATLRSLLACKWQKPICVMGMGPLGRKTRIEFPRLGSCLTYGYLDKPAAPGQSAAPQLIRRLRRLLVK